MDNKMYFRLQLKRMMKLFPAILAVMLLTVFAMGICGAVFISESSFGKDNMKVTVGITGDTSDKYMMAGLYALKNMDNSRFYVDFIEMEEEEAKKALKERKINGYAEIPEGFISGIYYGKNIPAKYYMLNSPDGLGSILTAEIASMVSDMVLETQNGIISMDLLAGEKGITENLSAKTDELNMKYLDYLFSRDTAYKVKSLGISDSLTTGGYYLSAGIMLMLLIWGISCYKLLNMKNISLSRSLKAKGMNIKAQITAEYLPYFIITFITFIVFSAVAGAVFENSAINIKELKATDSVSAVFFGFKMIPVILMVTLMQTACYEFANDTVSGILLQFLITFGGGYLSGFFYPDSFFPEAIRNIFGILPAGAGFSYVKKLVSESFEIKDLITVTLYSVMFFALTLFVRKKRMEGDAS